MPERTDQRVIGSCSALSTCLTTASATTLAQRSFPFQAVRAALDEHKAENIAVVDISGKSSFADHMIFADARSRRHAAALAREVSDALHDLGLGRPSIEGLERCDWILIDAGEAIVHIFRPELRAYYDLERLWTE